MGDLGVNIEYYKSKCFECFQSLYIYAFELVVNKKFLTNDY